jgi:hypothetical protein
MGKIAPILACELPSLSNQQPAGSGTSSLSASPQSQAPGRSFSISGSRWGGGKSSSVSSSQSTAIGDLGLLPDSRVNVTIARAKVVFKHASQSVGGGGRFCYIAIQEGEDGQIIGATKSTEGAKLHWHEEFQWYSTFSVPLGRDVLLRLWEYEASGHTLLAQASVPFSSLCLDGSCPVTKLEIPLIRRKETSMDADIEGDAGSAASLVPGDDDDDEGDDDDEDESDSVEEAILVLEMPSAIAELTAPLPPQAESEAQSLGVVRVIVWGARELQTGGKSKDGSYTVVASLDGISQEAPFDTFLEFQVHSITSDLRCSVLVGSKRKCQGQVIIPLTSLTSRWRACPPQNRWFEVLPPVPSLTHNRGGKYRPAMVGSRVDGFGLPRPETPLGFLKLGVELRVRKPVPMLHISLPPEGQASAENGGQGYCRDPDASDDLKITLPAVRDNWRRIERKVMALPGAWKLLRSHMRWRRYPFRSFLLLGAHTYVSWWMPLWQAPLALALAMMYFGSVASHHVAHSHTGGRALHVYQDEVSTGKRGVEVKEVRKRIRKFRVVSKKMQFETDRIASFMEKTANLLRWHDFGVSFVAATMLLAMAALLAAALYVFTGRANELYFYVGLGLFVPEPAPKKLPKAIEGTQGESVVGSSPVSGVLYAKDWVEGVVQLNALLDGRGAPWSGRWCQVRLNPPSLLTMSDGSSGGNNEGDPRPSVRSFDLRGAVAREVPRAVPADKIQISTGMWHNKASKTRDMMYILELFLPGDGSGVGTAGGPRTLFLGTSQRSLSKKWFRALSEAAKGGGAQQIATNDRCRHKARGKVIATLRHLAASVPDDVDIDHQNICSWQAVAPHDAIARMGGDTNRDHERKASDGIRVSRQQHDFPFCSFFALSKFKTDIFAFWCSLSGHEC